MDVAAPALFVPFLTPLTVSRTGVADRPVLLNVAAARGVAALHGCLRGRALAGSASATTLHGAAGACSPGSGNGSHPGSLPGSGSDSGGRVDDGAALARSAIDPREG
ncbi:hypothetical protein [Kribbella swartbergensis]